MVLAGANTVSVTNLIVDLAVATLYGKDKNWTAQLKKGAVTFDGTPGWHQALQELVEMNDAGCFQPGATGTTSQSATAEFAQGQGLMFPALSGSKGTIDAATPQFDYSFRPLASGTGPNQAMTFLNLANAVSVNAHSSAQNQAAAQTFVDFIARPKQNALYAQIKGSLTQYEFLKDQIPDFMSNLATVFKQHDYVINPITAWWNPNVILALQQDGVGLLTGQLSIDDVLNAMDAAWKQGPT